MNWNILPEIHKSCESSLLNNLLIEKKKVLIKDILMKTSIIVSVKIAWRGSGEEIPDNVFVQL